MLDWTHTLILVGASIRDALAQIEKGKVQIAIVVNENRVLQGIVTDGDIRRAILNGISLDDTVDHVMNRRPFTIHEHESQDRVATMMREEQIHQIPIVDDRNVVIGLRVIDEFFSFKKRDNPVVLMAGGLGTRLQPLTLDCPKPLLKVKDKPILENTLESLKSFGFWDFYISVNYRAGMIESYFGDGSNWNVEIKYLREKKRLGTAGALSLLPDTANDPILVMNGDVLTKLNFADLVDFHDAQSSNATMCVREYDMKVPFGVVNTEDDKIVSIVEKPVEQFLVNAGIYVLNKSTIAHVPEDEYLDMTELFTRILAANHPTSVYHVKDYWADIGRLSDYEKVSSGEWAYS